MKALVKYKKGEGNVEVRDIKIPSIPFDDWVLIKVKACGVCMTDLHVWHDTFRNYPPIVLGHEFSGQAVKIGPAVQNVKVGDHVVAEPKTGVCGICDSCLNGKGNLCPGRRGPGWGINGGMTDYVVMPSKVLHIIPKEMPFDIAALTEPMTVAVCAITELAGINCGDVVVISGAGSIGTVSAFVAKSCGASKVIVTGLEKSEAVRFAVAKEVGADEVINVEKEDAVKRVMELTGGKGADLIVETSGAGVAIKQSVQMARICGRIVGIGFNPKNEAAIEWNTAIYKGLEIRFNFSSSYTSWERAIKLMNTAKYDLKKIITTRALIDDWKQVFEEQAEERGVKAMFIPADEINAYQ